MPVSNKNSLGLHRPLFEQLTYYPSTTGIAGTSITDDGERYIYAMVTSSTTGAQFWRYDTWFDTWQQLASPPTTTIPVGKIIFTPHVGTQLNGRTFGSIISFQANGTVTYWYRYDIATNTWASALSVAGLSASWVTDAYVCFPQPWLNNWEGGYHSGVTMSVATSSGAAVGATSVAVNALSAALAAGTILDFGKLAVTLTSAAAKGATTLACSALAYGIASGAVITTPDGIEVVASSAAAAGATSIAVCPIYKAIPNGAACYIRRKAVLTAAAAAAATSLTVSGLLCGLESGAAAVHYDHMYLIGNNVTAMWRYSIAANAWSANSANAGNPALPALPGNAALGCSCKWAPLYYGDKLYIIRGGGTATIYVYDLATNTISTLTYYPNSETFTTGTMSAARSVSGKQGRFILQKDATMRFYEFDPVQNVMHGKGTQWSLPTGAAVVGDRATCLTSPEGVEFLYMMLHSSTGFLRCALIDQ